MKGEKTLANYGEQLLSQVIDSNDVQAFIRFNIEESDFPTGAERQAYRFISDYAEQNGGQAPSYATYIAENPDMVYIPDVTDSFAYMARQLKSFAAKLQTKTLIEQDFPKIFAEHDGITAVEMLKQRAEGIIENTCVRTEVGTNVKKAGEAFLTEYRKRKDGKSFRIWKSKFPTINKEIGGYLSGNMYTWYGRSGRGKSVFTMEEALDAAVQGATVLVWAMEMSAYEWMARAYSSLSARKGLVQAEVNGERFAAGFENKSMLMGKLPESFEESLCGFLSQVSELVSGDIILRAADDRDFENRSLRSLESDIVALKPDVVIIDPFYYLDYERNTSKTAGGDAAATSMRLRRLAGRYGIVTHVITQADEVKTREDDEGNRELNPPQRGEIKKTKQVLEDAVNVFGIDSVSKEGRGMITIGKGRNGGEDTVVEVVYLPNYGIVRESGIGAGSLFHATF